jgi:uncharacterized membrane protein
VESRSIRTAAPTVPRRLGASRWVPALVRTEPLLFALAFVAAVAYSLYAIWEHNHFQTDFDLAIADQAVWHYAHFSSPEITTINPPVNMLGDHFSPILIAVTPLYWLWSDPRMLLIVQGAVIAASVVPLFLFAQPRLGRPGAYLLALAYSLFWGISAAVGYQFHELAFAPLLIALCILFADRSHWTAYFVSLGALLLVKENMAVLAIFIGLWLISGREVRRGAITIGVGLVWYFLAVNVLLPAFAGHSYTHWTYDALGPDAPGALKGAITHPDLPFRLLFDNDTKQETLLLLVAPFCGLILGSRLIILCIPLVAQQLFSSYPAQWGTDFHYWLPIAPVLAMGAADGFHNLLRWSRREQWLPIAGTAVAAVMLAVNIGLAHRFPLWRLAEPGFSLSASATDAAAERAIDRVPGDASATVPASQAPHMSGRSQIHLLGYPSPKVDYVLFAPAAIGWPDPVFARQWLHQNRPAYRPVYDRDGWVVWERRDLAG